MTDTPFLATSYMGQDAPVEGKEAAEMSAHERHRQLLKRTVIVGGIAALIVAGLLWTRTAAPIALRIVQGDPANAAFSYDARRGVQQVSQAQPGPYLEYVPRSDAWYGVVADADGRDTGVIRVGNDHTIGALTATPGTRASLAVSADGSAVAFSEKDPQATSTVAIGNWRVVLQSQDRAVPLGSGYGSVFVRRDSKEYVVFGTEKGVSVTQLDPLETHTAFLVHVPNIRSVVADPDGKYLAMNDTPDGHYSVYAIDALYPQLALRKLGEVNRTLTSAAFWNGALYGVATVTGTQTLLKFDPANPGEGSGVASLPTSLLPYFVLP